MMSDWNNDQSNHSDALTQSCSGSTRVMILAWSITLGSLLFGLMAYSQQPGDLSKPPLGSMLDRELDQFRHTLFIAIHPRCPCTSASLYELERLVARSNGRLDVTILAYFPGDDSEEWAAKNQIGTVASLESVDWEWDENGHIASSMGCKTSGSVVLYSPCGQPLFWGGITSSRGHAGDNQGSDTILEILTKGSSELRSTPVYGCSLNTQDAVASRLKGATTDE